MCSLPIYTGASLRECKVDKGNQMTWLQYQDGSFDRRIAEIAVRESP